jgi:heptosyltransferase-2
MTRETPAVARLVVRPPNWLGDAVLALPSIAAVRRHFPDAALTIAAPGAVAAIFRERTDAAPDEVVELPAAHRGAIAALRKGQFDLGVLFPNSFRSAWQMRAAGVRERWGYPTSWRGRLLTRASRRARARGPEHQADYYRALVRGLDVACDDAMPSIAPTPASAAQAAHLLAQARVPAGARLVGLAPGAAYGQAKQWPPARAAALIARVVRETDARCVLVGAAHDRDAGRAIESWLRAEAPEVLQGAGETGPRVIDLVGRTSLAALTGVIARTSVFVSNDSGAMHLAAATGRPVVAIFGPTDERATRPLGDHDVIYEAVFCRPCLLRDCPIDHRCMKRITVDRVFDAVRRRLR